MIESNFYSDDLSVETPEQVDLRFPVAGIGSRFVAVLIDHAIQLVPYVVLTIVVAIWAHNKTFPESAPWTTGEKWFTAFLIFLNFLWFWGYFVLFEAYWKGQTPGKRVMKLRVLKDSGRSITFFEAMARNLIRFVDYFPGVYFVGLVTMLSNRASKRLGDLAAGTIVVHERVEEHAPVQLGAATYTPQAQAARAASEAGLPADAVAKLTGEDLHVIETFFARMLDLDLATRERLAGRLAEKMVVKMGIAPPEGVGAERLLELMVFRMRALGR